MKKYFVLFLILALALFLRLYKVTESPPSLNWDEAAIGYNAYSVLKTGRDEWGQFLPLHFKSYGEYKLPGQIYFSIPAIAILGLNVFAVRITPVVYGVISVFLLYFLSVELLEGEVYKREIGLASAFFLAVSPWHIQLTRASFESSFAVFWLILGVWFFVKGFKKSLWWIVSMVPFSLATYTYNSARAFIPLFIIFLVIYYRKDWLKKVRTSVVALVLFALLSIPTLVFFAQGGIGARYKLVSISNDPGLVPRIEERRNASHLPKIITNLIHNRYSYTFVYITRNYLAHFTPQFLFISGAGHKQHHIQKIGELYWVQAPLFLLGIYFLLKKKNKFLPLLVSWVLLAIFPVSLTQDSIPHALRTLNVAPVYQILTGVGLLYLIEIIRKKKIHLGVTLGILVLIFSYQFIGFLNNLFYLYPKLYSRDWQYGYSQVVSYIGENYAKYDLIAFTREYGEPHMFTLFFLNYSPEKYMYNQNLVRFETNDWVRVLKFDKFYFPDLGDKGTTVKDIVAENPTKKILFVTTPEEIPEDMKILKEIDFLDGKTAFDVTEY